MKNNNNNNKNIKIVPVVRYSNVLYNKSIILSENLNKSGVCRLVNNINGKSHILSSVSLNNKFNIYYSLDLLRKEKGSIIIYRALLKYGYSNFSLEIIEYCEPNLLMEREQYYIGILKPEYNIKKVYK